MKLENILHNLNDYVSKIMPHLLLFGNYIYNPSNKIRLYDFKIITTNKSSKLWEFKIIGPDNNPFPVKHPKLKFTSDTWSIGKYPTTVPWFLLHVPDMLFVVIIQWYIRSCAQKQWYQSPNPNDYLSLIS